MPTIRPATAADFPALWPIIRAVAAAGDTWTLPTDLTEAQGREIFLAPEKRLYLAELEGTVAGLYFLRANQSGPGDHVANAGYMVDPARRGRGVAAAMGVHSLAEARRLGFSAMQFNFVVAANAPAVALWKKLGFRIVGTLPGVFRHPTLGRVDAYVMFREL